MDYLVKPFNVSELQIRVQNLIKIRRNLQETFRREILTSPSEITVDSVNDKFLLRASKVVESNLGDPDFTVEQFAVEMAMSRSNLNRKIQALTTLTSTLFIRSIRLKRAAQLLKQQGATITEIAYDVGFTSSAYFTKCFREQFGKSPKEFQRTS